ncbi:MAG: hypothetical protein GJT30_12710 [Geobacter sp.]|nr:hypothetical protein [Geobacter sp.]
MKQSIKMQTSGDEHAMLFQQGLEPFFTVISASRPDNLLCTLSRSLKKAMILLTLKQCNGDHDTVCSLLGITRTQLAADMSQCGLHHHSPDA